MALEFVGGLSVCRVWCSSRFLHVLRLKFPSHRCFFTCGYQVKEDPLFGKGWKSYHRSIPGNHHGEEFVQAGASSGYV